MPTSEAPKTFCFALSFKASPGLTAVVAFTEIMCRHCHSCCCKHKTRATVVVLLQRTFTVIFQNNLCVFTWRGCNAFCWENSLNFLLLITFQAGGYMVMEGELTWGGEHTAHCTGDVY